MPFGTGKDFFTFETSEYHKPFVLASQLNYTSIAARVHWPFYHVRILRWNYQNFSFRLMGIEDGFGKTSGLEQGETE